MQLHVSCHEAKWTFLQKLVFRFCFVFFCFYIVPVQLVSDLPIIKYLVIWYEDAIKAIVNFANAKFFRLKDELVLPNGSGDTSFAWAQLLLFTWLAFIGSIVWSVLDSKRLNYARLNYMLCIGIRYFIAFTALLYGVIKVFAMQMGFPTTSQLATPLGDLLPMRFSWLFIGYSTPYQVFSGCMEVTVGLLLLFRRTATFGSVMAFVVFTNVMMLNLSYDIPVKLFSIQLVILSFFLLAQEYDRIMAFFVLNKEASSCNIYVVDFSKRWMRISRMVLKLLFLVAVVLMVIDTYGYYKDFHKPIHFTPPFKQGLYNITYSVNKYNAIKPWQNIVFDSQDGCSILTGDSAFGNCRYGRSYFKYDLDTVHKIIHFNKKPKTAESLFSLNYSGTPKNTILLNGKIGPDTVAMQFAPSTHRFQLAEKQFHWLSESNR